MCVECGETLLKKLFSGGKYNDFKRDWMILWYQSVEYCIFVWVALYLVNTTKWFAKQKSDNKALTQPT